MQYFLGYKSFTDVPPFDASLFVEFRKRLGLEQINAINERIGKIKQDIEQKSSSKVDDDTPPPPTHKGSMIIDATACPQDIAYPTDLDLLNDARVKSEELLDIAYAHSTSKIKPRNYRDKARKDYLKLAQKKTKHEKKLDQLSKNNLDTLGETCALSMIY
jgi:transposase, IS5 family